MVVTVPLAMHSSQSFLCETAAPVLPAVYVLIGSLMMPFPDHVLRRARDLPSTAWTRTQSTTAPVPFQEKRSLRSFLLSRLM